MTDEQGRAMHEAFVDLDKAWEHKRQAFRSSVAARDAHAEACEALRKAQARLKSVCQANSSGEGAVTR